jgi:hypothetical protein
MQKAKTGGTKNLSRIDGIVVDMRNQQEVQFKRSRALQVEFVALADYVKVSMASIGRISRRRNRPGSRSLK